ncbi:cornifelin homolog B [Carassius auratus]|uniref:Cornifelin homolog B n=1 Tax=Carassius auratus TaxID=7957 RepID=A0A6P6Q6Z5_CARAU|nr:cornifelin homolog B-like [Carassius auratus]XP_052422629.1 cornifelin homolog B isoform X1 [Carassius gibelio]
MGPYFLNGVNCDHSFRNNRYFVLPWICQHSGVSMSHQMVVMQPQPVPLFCDSGQWGSGICDCCDDVPECCLACWCFWCFTCMKAKKYGECLCLPLLDFGGLIPPITMSIRVSMRQRYGIRGDMCNDCLVSTFCTACVWCQMSREMKARDRQVTLVGARNL